MNIRDCLVALPVAGDAFLLNRSGRQILVDGGSGSARLLQELKNFNVKHLDVVVCTHADRDHAGGLVDFLDCSNSPVTVDEFWLPGSWAESLPALVTNPGLVVDDLIDSLDSSDGSNGGRSYDKLKKRLHETVVANRRKFRGERSRRQKSETLNLDEGAANKGLPREWFTEGDRAPMADSEAEEVFQRGRGRIQRRLLAGTIRTEAAFLWVGLIDTAERIRKIALQAHRHNALVRWFDYSDFAKTGQVSGGDKDLLVPINSVELQVPPPPPPLDFTYFNRLTPVNEECLVFVSPPASDFPSWPVSVLFTGDSPLGDGIGYAESWLAWPAWVSTWVIATAPHHGSENNSAAYHHLMSKVNVWLWIRSGGSKRHPGETYRSISSHRRSCTHCPRSDFSRQPVIVELGDFALTTYGRDCIC